MNAYGIFKYLHSGLRFVVLILILLAIIQAFMGWMGKKSYTEGNRKINLFAMISAHTQLLIGFVLYFLSPNVKDFSKTTMHDNDARYWTLEHWAMMLFAIALITFGYMRSKKTAAPNDKHRAIALYYVLAVVVIVAAIIQSHRPMFGISS
jgi:magnesium-transporting ATPase (P-type)